VSHLESVRGEFGYVDQVPRMLAYQQAHPHVMIRPRSHAAYWEAIIEEQDGETAVYRYTLRELMDKLESLAAAGPAGPGGAQDAPGR